MTVWAIADIHASPLDPAGHPQKPMQVFGDQWQGHVNRIEAAWNERVRPDDTVIVVVTWNGRFTWRMLSQRCGALTLGRAASYSFAAIMITGGPARLRAKCVVFCHHRLISFTITSSR